MEAESAPAESITEDVQIDVRNPSYDDIDNMAKNRTLEERTETSNKVPIGIKKSSEGLAQAPSEVHVSPRETLKDSDAISHAEQPYEEKEMPKHEVFQGIDSVSKLGDPKKETMEEDLQSEAEHTNLCTPTANVCSGNKKATNEDSENALDSASDNIIISENKNAPNHVKSEENTKDDAMGDKQPEEGIHNSQWDESLLTGLGVVKLAETSLLGSSLQNHEPADTIKNAEEKATEAEDQHMSKDVENISTEENILPNRKEGTHGPITVNKELLEESSNVASNEKISKPSEEREEQEKDTQQGKQNSLENSKAKDETIEKQSFQPAKQVSEETSVNDKERSDPEKGLEKDVQEEEKAAEESYITSSISELDKEKHSAIGEEETLIHEELSDSLKDKGRIQDELEMDLADSNVTKHDMQEALEANAEDSLIVNETTRGNKLEVFDYKESAKRKTKAHDESCNSSSHGPLNEASAHDNKERNPETKIEEIINEASNRENLELGNTKDGRGSNLVENIDGDPSKPEISLHILELQKQINAENDDEPDFNMKVSLVFTKEIDQDFSIVKKKNEDKKATEPGHLIVNEEEKLENSSHVSSDEIPKPSEPGSKQENKAMEKEEDFREVQPNKDKHDISEEHNNISANQVSKEETIHDQESMDSRKALEKYVQEKKESKRSTKTLSILESYKKTDSALEAKATENFEEVSNFLKDRDQIQEAPENDVQEEKAGNGSTNTLSILESYKKRDSPFEARETENSEEVSNFLKDKDQIQDELDKNVADPHAIKYDSQEAPKANTENLKKNEAATGAEHNKLEMVEDEEDASRSIDVHDDSCNSSSHSLLNKASKQEDTETDPKTRIEEIVDETVNQEKFEGKVKDGSICNQVDNFDDVPEVNEISKRISKPQKETVNKDEMILEIKQRLQEVTEEIDQDLSVMKQKNERKEATESVQLTMYVEDEHEESSWVASDENIPKPSKSSNKQEKEALEKKDGLLQEDQQTKDKDETKEKHNLIPVNEDSEEAIIHDQGAEDSGKGLETKVPKEEKVDSEGSIDPSSISKSNKETDSAIGEKETENSEEASNLLKEKDHIQDEFHKDSLDTHVSKYNVQGALETNAEESMTRNEAVTGTENNDLGMLEDEKDANKRAKIHDDSYNGSSNGLLNKASEHEDTESILEQKKVESVEEGIKQEDGGESNLVDNFDVLANISIISQQNLESQKKIVGKDETVLEMKERLQEATEGIDQDLSVMKQQNESKEATESGQLTMNLKEEHEESSCVASDENIPKQSKTSNNQEKEALERKDGFLEEDQQTKDKDETKEEQNLIPVNEFSEEAIIQDQGAEDSGKGLETKVREEENVDTEGSITPSISESNKETDSATGEKETEDSEEVSNLLKDKDQIQDEFHKDSVDTHVSKYNVQGDLETNAEESLRGNEAVTGTENNELGMLEDEKDANKRAKIHDDSCNGSSNGLLNKASEHEDTESVLEEKKVESVEEGIKQEDGGESNLVDNFDVLANISIISQQNLESQKKIVSKDETVLEMKERLQEATEETDQDLSVMKQKNEGKEATESGQLTMNVKEEHEESSCVASDENIPEPSKPSNKHEKEALERKDGFLEEDQQTKDKDETKEEQNLIPVNEVSEEAIIHDQGTEDSGKGLETNVREEEKVDTEGSITSSISESNKEKASATGEKETEDSEEVSNLLKDKEQIQDKFHKDSVDTNFSKYDVQGALETNAEESLTGNEAVTGTGNNDLGMQEDENDANKRAKIHDDRCNCSPNGLLNKASEHEDTERVLEQKKVESVEKTIKQKKFYLVNKQDAGESIQVDNFDVLSNISIISEQILESQEKIVSKDETALEMKERLQEATDEIDQDLSVMKQKNEGKEATESGQLTMNVEEEHEESACVASDENIPKPSKPSNKQEKEALEKKDGFLEEDQQIKDRDKTKEEQNLIPVNEVSEDAIIHDQGAEDSGNELLTKVREEEKVDTEGSITPFISESNKETDSAIGEKETENSEEVSNFLKDRDQIRDEFHKDVVETHVSKYDVQEALETNAEESLTGNEAVTGTENNDLGMLEDEKDANKRAMVHDDSCNGSSNDILNEASKHKDTERDPEPKKEDIVDEAIRQKKLDLGNIQDSRGSNKIDDFDAVADIPEISQQISEHPKDITGKDEMILEMKGLQEVNKEIDQHLSVTKPKYEESSTEPHKEETESCQLIVNVENKLEESSRLALDENIPEKKEDFVIEVQQIKGKDETREEQNILPASQVSKEKVVPGQERSDSRKGLETDVLEEETEANRSNISESDKEIVSAIGSRETDNFQEASKFLKDKDHIQDELDKDVADNNVTKYDVQKALEANAEESLTGKEAATVVHNNLRIPEDEEVAKSRAKAHVDSCNGSSNGLLNEASEHEDTERDPEPKKEEFFDEALKQEKLHIGNIQYSRESNQADNFDVVSDISEISEQITESRKEIAGKDEMMLDMNESLHEVTEETYQDLFVTKLKYEGEEATKSNHLIVNKEEELEESSHMASAENIPSPSESCSKAGEEVQEMEENFLKDTQQSKAEDKTIEEQNFARDNQVSGEKIVHNQERIDSANGLEKDVQEEKAATESNTTSFISYFDKKMHSAIRAKEVQNFEEVSSSLKDKDQVQNELDKDVRNTHVIKYDMQEALVVIAEESLTGNEATTVAEYNKLEKQNDEDYVETIANDLFESCNNCFQGSLDEASKHKDIQRDQEPTIEEISSETINQENLDLGNIKDGRKSKQVEKYIAEPRREILDKDGHNKITGTDELILNIKESFQEVKEKTDQDFPVMKQKDEGKEATKSWVHAKRAVVEYEVPKVEVIAMQDEDDVVEKSTPKANHMNNYPAYCAHEEPVYDFKCDADTRKQETEPDNSMNAYESISEDQSTGIANTEASSIGVEQEVMNINKTIDDSQAYMEELIELSHSIPKEKEHSDSVTMVEEAIHAREAENKARKTTVFEAEQRDADLSLHEKQKEGKEPDDMNEAQHENICCGGLDYESFPKENPAKTVPHSVTKNDASNENLGNSSTKQSDDFGRKETTDDQELIGQENVEAGLILDQADIDMDDDIPTDKPEGNNVEDTQATTIHNDNETAKDEDASKSKNDDYTSERLLLQHENKEEHQTQTRAGAEGMEQAKKKEQNEAVLFKEKASEITDSIEHDERACLEHKASPQTNSEGKLKEVVIEKNLNDATEELQIELGIDNFDEDAQVKQYVNDNIEESHLKGKDEILLKARAEWKSNYITEPIQSYDTKALIIPDEEIETQDAENDLQNEDTSYKQPPTGLSEKIEDKEVPRSSLEEEKMEQVQENADEIREKTLTAASLENELQQKNEALNVSLQANQIHQMELKKQTKNRSDKAGTDDVGLKIETSIMPDDSVTAATMEDKNSMPLQGNQNHSAIKLNETTRHRTPTREIDTDSSSGEHKSDLEVQADIASIVMSADVFSPNKSAAKNDGVVNSKADDDPQEVTAHKKETTHIDDKRDGAAAESSMQSQGTQQHQKKKVYEPTTEEKLEHFELGEMPIKDQGLAENPNYGTMKDKLAAKVNQLPQQSMKKQDIDKDTRERVDTSPSEETDLLQPSKELHNKITEVGNFDDEKNQSQHNDLPVSRFLMDHILREDNLHKSYVIELESKPEEKNELDKNGVSIKEQVTTALLPFKQTSEEKCTSDEAEAQNLEQLTDIKQEEKNNSEQEGTTIPLPSEHASIEMDTSEEAAEEHPKLEQTTDSMQDEKNNDVKEDKINMIISKDATQDSNIYDSSAVTTEGDGVENVFSCSNPFSGVCNSHLISSTSQLTTLEQDQIYIDGLVDTDLVQGEKDNEVNLEKQIKESGIHEVKEKPQEGVEIPSNVIIYDDHVSYEENGNEKEALQNAGNFNKAYNAIPQESSPLIPELNQKEKNLVQKEENFPTCESTEHSVLQESKLHGNMNDNFKIRTAESAELNPIQVSHSEAQDVKNVSTKMNLADTLNIQKAEHENFGTCKKEPAKSVLAQVEENESDREKGEKEEKEGGADRTVQVAEKNVEDCTSVSKDEKGKGEATINQVGEDNTDEERDEKEVEEGHKDEETGHEASTNVNCRDVVKPSHKKSHNILSGIGSKVKHSIAKVKKAITGKSSHSKTSTPK